MKIILLLCICVLMGSSQGAPAINLKGFFRCRESLLEENGNGLVCYAATQGDCRRGKVILAYEKLISKPEEHPIYKITDTVQVQVNDPTNDLSITRCTNAVGKSTQYFVLFKSDASGSKYLRNIRRVWGYTAQGQLVEVSAKSVKCLNEDFGAD